MKIKNLTEGNEGYFEITEGKKRYKLRYKLLKSRLKITDCEDKENKVAVDKRKRKIRIQRWGDVDWHREKK